MRALVGLMVVSLVAVSGCAGSDDADVNSETAVSAGTELVAGGTPSEFAVDLAERWGDAMETGDEAAIRALYGSGGDGTATIVDRLYRAVWTDANAAIESITQGNDFLRFETVAVEEFLPHETDRPGSGMIVAEYEVDFVPEESDDESGTPSRVVVVFHNLSDDGLIGDSDIYFPYFSSFVTGEVGGYPQRTEENEEGWIIVDQPD